MKKLILNPNMKLALTAAVALFLSAALVLTLYFFAILRVKTLKPIFRTSNISTDTSISAMHQGHILIHKDYFSKHSKNIGNTNISIQEETVEIWQEISQSLPETAPHKLGNLVLI